MTSTFDQTTAAELIAAALKRHGIGSIFAQSLPSALVLAAERIGIRQIAYRQENTGGVMADGFARLSGKVGVVCAQNGPAATLLVPPLAEALKASVPIVALVQEVESDQIDKNAFQELDHHALFAGVAKWVRTLRSPERAEEYIDRAIVAATSGRPGPAVLMLPADVLRAVIDQPKAKRTMTLGHWPLDPVRPSVAAIEAAADAISRARRPLIYAGGGALRPEARKALSDLQELCHLPVLTTNMGKGIVDEHHPLSAGVLASLTGPASLGRHTRALMDDADLVLLVGTRNNQNGTDSWRLFPKGAQLIQVDMDPQEIGANYEAMRLVGDAAEALTALTEALSTRDLSHLKENRPAVEKQISDSWFKFNRDRAPLVKDGQSPVRPERIMRALQDALPDNAIVVADASYSSMWAVGQLRTSSNMRVVTPRGLAGLGWGLPLALGAKVAEPDRPVVALVGDGGFAHSWSEVETMVRMKLPVTIIVLNNGILGFQTDAETVKFGQKTTACDLGPVDHAAIALACGCESARIDHDSDLGSILKRSVAANAPFLLEIMTCPKAHPALSLFDGTLDFDEAAK